MLKVEITDGNLAAAAANEVEIVTSSLTHFWVSDTGEHRGIFPEHEDDPIPIRKDWGATE